MIKSMVVSAVKGANNRTDIKAEVIKELRNSENPLSTSDLALKLGKAWHTIDRACLMLKIENKLDGFRVGKMNLWRIK